MPEIEKIHPEFIRLDGDTQPRARMNPDVCSDYGERMKAGDPFDPIDVYFDGENYWLADGFHRIQAKFMAQPGEPIECNVYQGTLEDAQWHSYGVNKTHGLRRTNEDKRRAVQLALVHPVGAQASDRQIADHVGVHFDTVTKYRRELERQGTIGKSDSRTGRDGRTIKTTKIGQTPPRKTRRPRSAAEYMEARRAGRQVQMPPSIVKLELPNNHVHNCAYGLLKRFTFEYLQEVFQEIVQIQQQEVEQEISQ